MAFLFLTSTVYLRLFVLLDHRDWHNTGLRSLRNLIGHFWINPLMQPIRCDPFCRTIPPRKHQFVDHSKNDNQDHPEFKVPTHWPQIPLMRSHLMPTPLDGLWESPVGSGGDVICWPTSLTITENQSISLMIVVHVPSPDSISQEIRLANLNLLVWRPKDMRIICFAFNQIFRR